MVQKDGIDNSILPRPPTKKLLIQASHPVDYPIFQTILPIVLDVWLHKSIVKDSLCGKSLFIACRRHGT